MAHKVDFSAIKQCIKPEHFFDMLFHITFEKESDTQWHAECPECKGGDRSLAVGYNKVGFPSFFCHASDKSGNLIEMYAHVQKISFYQAASLYQDYLDGDFAKEPDVPVEPKAEKPKKLPTFEDLELNPDILAKLKIDEDTCHHFKCGYMKKGVLAGRFAIPIYDMTGNILAYCGLTIKDEDERYKYPKNFTKRDHLFNLQSVKKGSTSILEEPLQVLYAYQYGVENVISLLP